MKLKHMQNQFEVVIDIERNYGYFEHKIYGDELGGGLWFKNRELVDFDGTMVLPIEVAISIRELGFICDIEQFCE
jgi:hypothetical protein